MYDLEFGRRMECLEDHYETPYEASSSDEAPQVPPPEPRHRDFGVQTTKKTNKDAEIAELKASLIECTEELEEVQDRLNCALKREKRHMKENRQLKKQIEPLRGSDAKPNAKPVRYRAKAQ
jgi:peptidoglycan hydrolase CwlO-like protein